jgi:hypothetical protein
MPWVGLGGQLVEAEASRKLESAGFGFSPLSAAARATTCSRAAPATTSTTAVPAATSSSPANGYRSETVNCGTGVDRAFVDPGDRTSGCERVFVLRRSR